MFPASFASSWLIKHGGPKGRRARAFLPCTIFCRTARKTRSVPRESGQLSRPENPFKTDPNRSGSPRSTINAKKTKIALPLCQKCGPRSFRNPSPLRQGDSTASSQVVRDDYCWVKSLDLRQSSPCPALPHEGGGLRMDRAAGCDELAASSRVRRPGRGKEMVPGTGIEPVTRGFSIRCSTN